MFFVIKFACAFIQNFTDIDILSSQRIGICAFADYIQHVGCFTQIIFPIITFGKHQINFGTTHQIDRTWTTFPLTATCCWIRNIYFVVRPWKPASDWITARHIHWFYCLLSIPGIISFLQGWVIIDQVFHASPTVAVVSAT